MNLFGIRVTGEGRLLSRQQPGYEVTAAPE